MLFGQFSACAANVAQAEFFFFLSEHMSISTESGVSAMERENKGGKKMKISLMVMTAAVLDVILVLI